MQTTVQLLLELVECALQVLVCAAQLVDLGDGVHHRGVVLVAKLAADLRQAGLRHILGEVHGDLPGTTTLRELFFCFRSLILIPNCSATAR